MTAHKNKHKKAERPQRQPEQAVRETPAPAKKGILSRLLGMFGKK
jgi:hypothetical protein